MHLVNASRDSNELKLFEPSRQIRRGERVLSEARVVIPAMSELSAAIAVQERIKSACYMHLCYFYGNKKSEITNNLT